MKQYAPPALASKAIEVEQVHSSSETSKLSERNQLQEVQQEEFLKADKSSEVKKVELNNSSNTYEFTLTNTNFGFNNSSQDFFVRAQRGSSENQYPTEDMMKLKSYIMNLNNASQEIKLEEIIT